jgi:hypothetical protein
VTPTEVEEQPEYSSRNKVNSRPMAACDEPVRSALRTFADEVLDGSWNGRREREAVSAFAFGPLLQQMDRGEFLEEPTQIGIEFPIPQVTLPGEDGDGKKDQVCKDLVIWEEPLRTCWDGQGDPTNAPAAILEWKFSSNRVSERDVKWLEAFTSEYPGCTGYAVTGNSPGSAFRLSCTRVSAGRGQPSWVHVD